ncbi:MAG: hypothetical protein KAW41_01830 [Candidatus Diapherotrites archaeon]|nr:hypothetical protein [Candidatus Diapherotrites archaeon]
MPRKRGGKGRGARYEKERKEERKDYKDRVEWTEYKEGVKWEKPKRGALEPRGLAEARKAKEKARAALIKGVTGEIKKDFEKEGMEIEWEAPEGELREGWRKDFQEKMRAGVTEKVMEEIEKDIEADLEGEQKWDEPEWIDKEIRAPEEPGVEREEPGGILENFKKTIEQDLESGGGKFGSFFHSGVDYGQVEESVKEAFKDHPDYPASGSGYRHVDVKNIKEPKVGTPTANRTEHDPGNPEPRPGTRVERFEGNLEHGDIRIAHGKLTDANNKPIKMEQILENVHDGYKGQNAYMINVIRKVRPSLAERENFRTDENHGDRTVNAQVAIVLPEREYLRVKEALDENPMAAQELLADVHADWQKKQDPGVEPKTMELQTGELQMATINFVAKKEEFGSPKKKGLLSLFKKKK